MHCRIVCLKGKKQPRYKISNNLGHVPGCEYFLASCGYGNLSLCILAVMWQVVDYVNHILRLVLVVTTHLSSVSWLYLQKPIFRFPSLFAGVTFMRNLETANIKTVYLGQIQAKTLFFPSVFAVFPCFLVRKQPKPRIAKPQITRAACICKLK